ncbi:MAG: carboxy terminal-processing peptidase [Flavobacteriaceae bacterium]|nr:carboxy terminal-processing peptidase [Flavobacteriaceae bacterium]MDG1961687.1 carboxy terminal-processing peptidase [Flavobacteriaceae bacterium]
MRFVKKNWKLFLLGVFIAVASCGFTSKEFNDPNKDKLLVDLINYVLEKGHYAPKDINDDFSQHVYENFIESLDPIKRYFLASDLEEFAAYELLIDDQIKAKDFTFFDLVLSRYIERSALVRTFYSEILEVPFDFDLSESISTDYQEAVYPNTPLELKERWRKQLKYSTLSNYYDLIQDKEKAQEKLLDTAASNKELLIETLAMSDQDMEAKARATTKTALDESYEFTDDLERKDYFALFLNAIVGEFDPHTNYFAPPDRDRFDLRMSGKLEGIGARLQKKSDYITIVEVISGGPVWRGDHLEVGDAILKVQQEDETEPVSVVGMRVNDAVKLIKGPKGTKVTLTIKRVDGSIDEETIERDVVELEETYAKSTIIDRDGKRFGMIHLPAFYFDMKDYQERNAATDVQVEIQALKQAGIEGLVLDLRGNGGGSLRTAVDIAGLFIKEGPVVQVASSGAKKEVLKDRDASIEWEGPLVILMNELSASASEILAAAMQDYKRAIILGSSQSYGKGTVQNMVDLNQWLRNNDMGDMGALKLTTQKFYRVTGGSTQLEGVKSDVVMPDRYSYIEIGERDYENPLPYDKISAAEFELWSGYIDYETTIEQSIQRMSQNAQVTLIDENALWIKQSQDQTEISLNIKAYQSEMSARQKESERFEKIKSYDNHLDYRSLDTDLSKMEQDTTLREKRKRWHESLAKDVYLEEAINILLDLETNNIRPRKVAKINH